MLEAQESVAIRLAIGPSPRRIDLPADYRPVPGVGVTLREGRDAMLVSYGPVMVHEALTAAELLAGQGIEAAVVAMPWLDRVDGDWLAQTFGGVREVLVVEDHAPVGALGDTLRRALATLAEPPALDVAGVEGWPACGTSDRGAAVSPARRRVARGPDHAFAGRHDGVSPLRDDEIVFVTNTRFTPWLERSQAAIEAEFPTSRRLVLDGRARWPEAWFRWIRRVRRAREPWVCLVDEDCFLCARDVLASIVARMDETGSAVAGVPDHFFVPRDFNELAMNPFFLVVDRRRMLEAMRRVRRWRKLRVRPEWFERARYPWAPDVRREAVEYEPFYSFFWLFYEAEVPLLYLYPHEDFRFANEQGLYPATGVRLEPSAPDACLHLWYSREWNAPDHRERYARAVRWLEAGRPSGWSP